jgi:hypothetical protein
MTELADCPLRRGLLRRFDRRRRGRSEKARKQTAGTLLRWHQIYIEKRQPAGVQHFASEPIDGDRADPLSFSIVNLFEDGFWQLAG